VAAGLSLPFLLEQPALGAALKGADRAARSDAPLLLVGEPGSGRSSVARALHAAGRRAGRPLVEVDPGSFPSSLFESELFGYRPGAFTGAEHSSEGRVALAEGGTLLLDHVEELPLAAQPKLLRLLAERRYSPLGAGDRGEREADVRFLAIGAEDLPFRVEHGSFRADLFYRLEVLTFRVLPLRERREDFPAILRHLLDDLGERFGRPGLTLSSRALGWLPRHGWPGNLRQLRNVLERSLVLSSGSLLDPPPPEDSGEARPATLLEMEKAQIRKALAFARGHQGRAAELLGISRKALWEKRKRYGIP
jgi:DNA-binding NtrC family response regulator